jgi:iron-sulfur cluster repair protein YtfE (RIC family)
LGNIKQNLKNNGIVDVEVLVGVVNELKAKLNTLIKDVLGVEHSINNIHNYNNTNIKDLKEITDQIGNVHTDINNIVAKLSNITSTTTKLSLNNPSVVEIKSVLNNSDDGS